MKQSFQISAVLSFLICFYMILYYDIIIGDGYADFTSERIIGLVRLVLSLAQLSMSIVYAYFWKRFRIWEKPQRKSKSDEPEHAVLEDGPKGGSQGSLLGRILGESEFYKSSEFWRVLLYVLVSFIGTFFYPPLFFIHIFDIFCNTPTLSNIFKAIGYNISSLLLVSMMGVVFVLIFCTVTFSNYMKNVYSE